MGRDKWRRRWCRSGGGGEEECGKGSELKTRRRRRREWEAGSVNRVPMRG